MTPTIRFRQFVGCVFSGCEGVLELRSLPSRERAFLALDDHDAVAQFCRDRRQNQDLYFGVATRRDGRSGDLTNCRHLGALFVDIDGFFDADQVLGGPLAPTIIVASGGGHHLYWRLREPLDLPDDADRAKNLLRRLATAVGGDLAAAEPARILRVPGTFNRKHAEPRPVQILHFEPERQFNPSDLDEMLPSGPIAVTTVPVDLSRPIGENRNRCLYRLGRGLKGKGLPAVLIAETLDFINRRCCQPALEGWEVQQIVAHVLQQPDRPMVQGRQPITIEVG
jgi:hypothetical protein